MSRGQGNGWLTSGALVLAGVDVIGPVIGSLVLQVLPAEGGAGGRCRRSVAGAGEIAASEGSGDRGWRQGCDGHELSSPIDRIGHSRGWQPGSKVLDDDHAPAAARTSVPLAVFVRMFGAVVVLA